jgi:FMN phosphatase YigB (HAD superfamily)
MVSLDRIHMIGSWYMSTHGGFKPSPKAFIAYFKEKGLKPKRIFFLGNRLVDMKLASALKKRLDCKVFKCLLVRNGGSIAGRYDDVMVYNLRQVSEHLKKFRPDLVMSDFDNTLVHSGYHFFEQAVERTRFWEKHGKNKFLRMLYGVLSHAAVPFLMMIKRAPYESQHDSTESFLKKLKVPLLIHTMSPEILVRLALKKII